MAQYLLKKRYDNFYGLDLKSTDLTRPEQYASGMLNAQYRKSGSVEKRKGYQATADSEGGFGLFTYNKVNSSGEENPEVLSVSTTLNKLNESVMTVSYSGSDPTVLISIFYDTVNSGYRCQIIEGTSTLIDTDLGVGFDELSPVTIGTLSSSINALANFTSSVTGSTSTPAAFIKVVRNHDLSAGGSTYTGVAHYWTEVNKTQSSPMSGSESNKNSLNFENVTAIQTNNIMMFSNGYNDVHKYDGQTFYRVGLPTPASVSSALVGSGSITGTNYQHVIQYIQKDAVGNFISGNNTKGNVLASATAEDFDVTIANVQQGSGFNTNCALSTSNQTGVTTIAVDNGAASDHSLQVGDTAYFLDRSTGNYVEREITARTSSSITIAGAAVNVNNNDPISNNLRIAVYRNKTSGTTPTAWFLVAEIPNDSYNATQVFRDAVVDASLGAQFVEPLTDRSPPSRGKYISTFNNQVLIAGNPSSVNTVYYSDIDGPEYFPVSNQFDVQTRFGDIITGLSQNNEVFSVFKQKSIHIVSGDFAQNNFRVDQLTDDIGCAAHATIKEVRGSLYFLSDRGPYQMTGGQIPSPVGGSRLEPVFDAAGLSQETKQLLFGTTVITDNQLLRLKRAVAINDRDNERYILYIPTESTTGGNRHANTSSKIFAYEYDRDAWLLWDNINAAGGFTIKDDEFYFSERRYSTFNYSVDHVLYRRMNLGDSYDYQDNTVAIDWNYISQWEALGEPSILKKFIKLRFFALEELPNNDLMIDVKEEHNYVRDVSAGQFSLAFAGEGYGISAYGTSPYGDPAESSLIHKLANGRVRSHRYRFENTSEQENAIISGFETEIAAPFRPEFKS